MKQNDTIELSMLPGMLTFIPAHLPRDDWARMLMAAKSEFGDSAREIMRDWSATAANYDRQAFNSTWKSIKAGGGVTIASLVHEAKENGYRFAPVSKEDRKLLQAEQKRREAARKQEEKAERQQREQGYRIAKESAEKMLRERAFVANPMHPYFMKKGIQHEVRALNWVYQLYNTLMVPVCRFRTPRQGMKATDYITASPNIIVSGGDGNERNLVSDYSDNPLFELMSLQYIDQNGGKFFLKGGQTKGGFFPVRFDGHILKIVICEGLATAVTYATHYAPDSEVICAFNARNLKDVAKEFKVRFPMAEITIAGDNDRATEQKTGVNVGVVKAMEAARLVDGEVMIPAFADDEPGTDWNDRFLLDSGHPSSQPYAGMEVMV